MENYKLSEGETEKLATQVECVCGDCKIVESCVWRLRKAVYVEVVSDFLKFSDPKADKD